MSSTAVHVESVPVDDWLLNLIAAAIRCGELTTMGVFRVGAEYNAWTKSDPDPFELRDADGNVVWREQLT